VFVEVVIMVKDLFAQHTPVRFSGFEVCRRLTEDASLLLKYKHSECADFLITLDFDGSYFALFGFRLSFCLVCGRFLGFGTCFELCWICESELE
jgi:hypothetical protein